MTFRANEDAASGYQKALNYLVTRYIDPADREKSRADFDSLVDEFGPVVQGYPCWHPLVACGNSEREPWTTPSENSAYRGLDHTIFLRDAFITCPYGGEETVIQSVENLPFDSPYSIKAERLDMTLYHPQARPILVKCQWDRHHLSPDGTIPKSLAVPLLLEFEVPCWRSAQVAETWETMRPYILGEPSGRLSSLFISKETGTVLKKLWNDLIYSGMYGPIKV